MAAVLSFLCSYYVESIVGWTYCWELGNGKTMRRGCIVESLEWKDEEVS
jgi:hypothetical protein